MANQVWDEGVELVTWGDVVGDVGGVRLVTLGACGLAMPTPPTPLQEISHFARGRGGGQGMNTRHGPGWWGRRPEGDAPKSEACVWGSLALPARPQPPTICHPSWPVLEPGQNLQGRGSQKLLRAVGYDCCNGIGVGGGWAEDEHPP